MRILHTSDWHLGRVLHEHSLLRDQEAFLAELLGHLQATPYEALVVAGDVFDRSIPSEEAVGLWNAFLEGFRKACPDTAMLVIAGNHDSAARVALASRLLEAGGIHIRGGGERLEEPVRLRDAAGLEADVWLVPFLWSGSLVVDGEGGPVALQTQEAALTAALARIRDRMDSRRINLLAAHCFTAGSEISDSERSLVGTASQVDRNLFEGFDYVALGHIHKPQRLGDRVRYSGSPLAYSFSEAGQEKSLVAVTLAPGTGPQIELIPVRPPTPMVDLQGSLEELLTSPAFEGLANAYVRVSLTEPSGVTQPVARLRTRFHKLLEFREYQTPLAARDEERSCRRKADLGDDFLTFERRLRAEDPPPALVEAFTRLRQDLERAR